MSTLKIDELKNNGSAIDLPNGIKVGGNEIVQGYTSSGTQPASPAKGDFWWDSTNQILYQYVNGEFKEIGIVANQNIDGATYDNVSFSVGSQDGNFINVTFSGDGTKLFLLGLSNDSIFQYSLSTAFDISTASYTNVSFSITNQDSFPYDMWISPAGTKMWMVGLNSDKVHQYTLATANNLATASYDNVYLDVSSRDNQCTAMAFKPDGTKFYIVGVDSDTVYQYTLSTAYNITTASYDNVTFSLASQDGTPNAIRFNPDGTKMYMLGNSNDTVFEYTLSTAYDISTASYDDVSFSVTSQDASPRGMTFNNDFSKMYIMGPTADYIYQYSTGL
jgi:hypothetical protein